jgi:LDH2 family malate/lactate/ureidoglycolate dehydrogenase
VLAIDPNLLGDQDEFIGNVTTLIGKVKATAKLPGIDEIFVPGERGNRQASRIKESGVIEIEDNLLEKLKKAAG